VQEYFIRQALVDAGWNRDQVDDAMDSEEAWPQEARKDIENGGATLKLPKRILPKKHFIISLPRILSLIFVVAIIGMVATSFYQDRKYEIVLPDGEGNLSSFDFYSSSSGAVVGTNVAYTTKNQGASWTQYSIPDEDGSEMLFDVEYSGDSMTIVGVTSYLKSILLLKP